MSVSEHAFGAREFQLVMLRRMADHQPGLVEEARTSLGANATEMRAANARWQRMLRSPRAVGGPPRLRSILGPPIAEFGRRVGDLDCRIVQWRLPLWPGLRFEALYGPGPAGAPFLEMLVRDPESRPPQPEALADLTPWTYVIGEVAHAFAPVRHVEGSAPRRATILFEAAGLRVAADFVWGLLQTVRELPA